MMRARGKGFTLIELLVVIAIIAILAAMLFPVFARARESARKIQCLSNVKNIAMAVQMYLGDYDGRFWPGEHRQEVIDYFESFGACGEWTWNQTNPYLREAVVLDEYVKNRDVWRCPSAKLTQGATFIFPVPDWFGFLQNNEGRWVPSGAPSPNYVNRPWCEWGWPKGWGGAVTDTLAQDLLGAGSMFTDQNQLNAFTYGIGTGYMFDRKATQIQNPSNYVVVFEVGASPGMDCVQGVAFPETCGIAGSTPPCTGWSPGEPTNWENCGESSGGCVYNTATNDGAFLRDPTLRKQFTRHMGGVNMGFADGHAQWMSSEAVVAKVANKEWTEIPGAAYPNSQCGFAEQYPGQPTLY